jgi:hypothetical protein
MNMDGKTWVSFPEIEIKVHRLSLDNLRMVYGSGLDKGILGGLQTYYSNYLGPEDFYSMLLDLF